MSRTSELEAEVLRLRERLAVMESRADTTSRNDMGVAGRVAITRLRDADYPELVAAVAGIPAVRAERGAAAAEAYVRTHVRSLVDAIVLQAGRTADLVRSMHRLHMLMGPGFCQVLQRPDRAGLRARTELLELVERLCFAPSVRAAFAHGSETPAGILPPSYVPNRGD